MTSPKELTLQQIAAKALQVLDERGWHQGSYQHPNGAVCVLGACNVVIDGMPGFWDTPGWPAKDALHAAFDKRLNTATGVWNDAPERTEDEVRALLRQIADS